MSRLPRPCLDCGIPSDATRCTRCRRAVDRQRGTRAERGYDNGWIALSRRAIAAQPWCSYCRTPGSRDNPLTGDHVVPLSNGGANVASNVVVACRRCNSAKGQRSAEAFGERGGRRKVQAGKPPAPAASRRDAPASPIRSVHRGEPADDR